MVHTPSLQPWLDGVEQDGFTIVPGVFPKSDVEQIVAELEHALARPSAATAIRTSRDTVYAARNVLEVYPKATDLWRRPMLVNLLERLLGPHFGLVRGLYFDKPPDRTWALPWHKDMTIAVQQHRQPPGPFAKPTRKAGVPHVEASLELLEAMVTVRIHLDDVTEMNGPMLVIPGSHRSGKVLAMDESKRTNILAERGDVLLIRPLVAHSSAASQLGNVNHRRILHLEFAGRAELPGGYVWHTFIPGTAEK